MEKKKLFHRLPSALTFFSLAVVLSVMNISSNNSIFRMLNVAKIEERGLLPAELDRIAKFQKVAPSVVFIDVYSKKPALQGMGKKKNIEVLQGLGSGYVWDKQGHIVTNYHVVEGASTAEVSFLTKKDVHSDDTKLLPTSNYGHNPSVDGYHWKVTKAKIVGVDPGNDIALLKVDVPPAELFPVELGSSKGLQVGQEVFAIGNPYGLDHSMSHGIVSALNRIYEAPDGNLVKGCIQTDAAINPGNSGGVLLDSSGRFVGMNTAGYSEGGGSSGIGLAVPGDTVKVIVRQLMKNGTIKRPMLGASMMDSVQTYMGIKEGVLLLEVAKGGPAAKAGLKGTYVNEVTGAIFLGDVIVSLNDRKVQTEMDVFEELENCVLNEKVKVKFIRYTERGTQMEKETVVQLFPIKNVM